MWPIIQVSVVVLICWTVLTQVIWPIFTKKPLFPAFKTTPIEQILEQENKIEEDLKLKELEKRVLEKQKLATRSKPRGL